MAPERVPVQRRPVGAAAVKAEGRLRLGAGAPPAVQPFEDDHQVADLLEEALIVDRQPALRC
ncbi:MAG: hypothetical protein ACYCYK_08835 [Candidatus Dormibacteria bacterium]